LLIVQSYSGACPYFVDLLVGTAGCFRDSVAGRGSKRGGHAVAGLRVISWVGSHGSMDLVDTLDLHSNVVVGLDVGLDADFDVDFDADFCTDF
jgi:hypothetical protein